MDRDGYVVIIPSRNRLIELLRAARSALAQTVPPKEVFIVDDASTDRRYHWLEELLGGRVTVIRRPRWSMDEHRTSFAVGAVRNDALAVIATKRRPAWIAFLDDDDEWMPEKMERQLRAARTSGAGLVCCNAWNRDSSGAILGNHHTVNTHDCSAHGAKVQGWEINDELLRWNHVVNSTAVISAEVAARLGPQIPAAFGEDWDYWQRASEITTVLFLNETLAYYSVGNRKEYSI